MNIKNLYVHIPFCQRRCYYCDFASSEYKSEVADSYLEALGVEFTRRAYGMCPETIYIGGGTPTCLPYEKLEQLLDILDLLEQRDLKEFTVEANPGTLSMEKLLLLRDAGVTRVSLGVQTFNQRGLDTLGRFHSAKDARFAVALLHEAGFDNISVDLIFAWPDQRIAEWREDLEKVLRLDVPHVSCYGLTYPEGTTLHQMLQEGRVERAHEDREREMFDLMDEVLASGGLRRYEISNFARPGHESMHNVNYWMGGTYTGLGAGAHSYEGSTRFGNCGSVTSYIGRMNSAGTALDSVDELPPEARARECAVIWLRMIDGINREAFRERTGRELDELLGPNLAKLIEGGWLEWNSSNLRLTNRALPVADAVLADIV